MIAYKVVGKKHRYSTNLSIYLYSNSHINITGLKKSSGSLKYWEILFSKFFFKYTKGKIIEADHKTEGIFCFKRKKYAEAFIKEHKDCNLQILKVKGIGKANYNPKIIMECGADPQRLTTGFSYRLVDSYEGTVCFPKIEVLE